MRRCTATAFLNVARADVGYREGENNSTKYGVWYGMPNELYCDMAVSFWGAKAGGQDIIGTFAYTPWHMKWFEKQGRWGVIPSRGALVFFRFPSKRNDIVNHVGVVLDFSKTHITTIEANTNAGSGNQNNGDGVYVRSRSRSLYPGGTVVGYGTPDFLPESSVTPLPEIPDGLRYYALGSRMLQVGSKGTDVAWVQRALGFRGSALDGEFGRVTLREVRDYQGRNGLIADGIVGPRTWGKLLDR
jgi:peptidoglycan hydrolase-like protein with peptidoglycan-binding domain